jgi:SAM-dependent methyltransferase
MGVRLISHKASFEFFKDISYKTDQYYLNGKWLGAPIKKFPVKFANTFMLENLVVKQIDLGNNQARTIVKKEAIDRFHPNNINNKDFWVESRKHFPLLSICGSDCKSMKNVNQQTLKMSKDIGLFHFLNAILLNSKEKLNVLEIGFGYGNLFFEIKDICNYYGIDYVVHKSLKKYKNFIEINESGIPDYLLDEGFFNIIYCVNVLQHCSQKDRFKYFQQGYDALKSGGYFIFTEFLMTEQNKNDICWGVVDESGRGYTHFFNQLTECDWDYELRAKINKIGFEPVKRSIVGNNFCMIMKKK